MMRRLRQIFGVDDPSRVGAAVPARAPVAHGPSSSPGTYNLMTTTLIGPTLVVTILERELRGENAGELNAQVRLLLEREPMMRNVVLDMANIRYIDSAGLSMLVDLLSVVKPRGGRIAVASVTTDVEVLFKLTRLELVFVIRREVLEAIDAVQRRAA